MTDCASCMWCVTHTAPFVLTFHPIEFLAWFGWGTKMFLSWGDPHDVIFSLNVFSSYPWSSFYLAVEFHAHWQFLLSVPITEDLCVTAVDKKTAEFTQYCYALLWCNIQFLQIIALNSQRKILLQTMQWCLCNVI